MAKLFHQEDYLTLSMMHIVLQGFCKNKGHGISTRKGLWISSAQRKGEIAEFSPEVSSEGRKLANELGEEVNAVI